MKTRASKNNLRHPSLGKDMKNWHTTFQNDICNNNGDILVQKNNMKKIRILPFSRPISVKENQIFIVCISIDRVHNQYLKHIEIRI